MRRFSALGARSRNPALLVVLTLAAVTIGCGSEDPEKVDDGDRSGGVVDISGAEPVGEETAGSVAQLAQCRDWNRGTYAEKLATIADIRGQFHPEDSGVEAPPLSDGEAMDAFDGACEPAHAQGFRLYILYARAAGVAPLFREP